MTASPDGGGYWLVASDGGIFSFGAASYYGSTGGMPLERTHRRHGRTPPTVGATGSWRVTEASSPSATLPFFGSAGGLPLNRPVVGMAAIQSLSAGTAAPQDVPANEAVHQDVQPSSTEVPQLAEQPTVQAAPPGGTATFAVITTAHLTQRAVGGVH